MSHNQPPPPPRCRRCRGSGVDPDARHRHTSGGRDSRDCPDCHGEGVRLDTEQEDDE